MASFRTKVMPCPGYTVLEQNQHFSSRMAARGCPLAHRDQSVPQRAGKRGLSPMPCAPAAARKHFGVKGVSNLGWADSDKMQESSHN